VINICDRETLLKWQLQNDMVFSFKANYRRANLDVSLLRNESRLDWLPKEACGLSVVPSVTPPPEPPGRRPGICPWNVRRLEIPRGNFVPTVGETAGCLDVPELSPDLCTHTQQMTRCKNSIYIQTVQLTRFLTVRE